MSVVYLNTSSFPVAVERLRDRSLEGRPVAVAAALAVQAPVFSVSAEAYEMGLRRGMKVGEVKKIDRGIQMIPANLPLYEKGQRKMLQVVQRFTPVYEPARLGSFYLDMAGTERLFGKTVDVASKMQNEVFQTIGIRSTAGVAQNKLVSRIAAKVIRPKGLCDVFPGYEENFLAPLDIELLPALRDFPARDLLKELSIQQIRDLLPIPIPVLIHLFGKYGEWLKAQAQGVDCGLVAPPIIQDSIEEENILAAETNDEEQLRGHWWGMVERLGRKMRAQQVMAGEGKIRAIYSDRKIVERHFKIVPPTNLDFSLFQLFLKTWNKAERRRVAFHSLFLSFTKFCPVFQQIRIDREEREQRLVAALDRLRGRFGEGAIRVHP